MRALMCTALTAAMLMSVAPSPARADFWDWDRWLQQPFGAPPRPISPERVAETERRARQGDAGEQLALGLLYKAGRGVPQDYAEAVRWFRRSADQGNGDAQYRLGRMYALGKGVPISMRHAYFWLNLAAARNASGAYDFRNSIAANLTDAEIAAAQRRSRLWIPGTPAPR